MTKRKPAKRGTYLHAYITAERRAELDALIPALPLKRPTISAALRFLIEFAITHWGNDEKKRPG